MGKLQVAVVGSGNQGLIMAGALSLRGCSVALTDTPLFESNLRGLAEISSIEIRGPVLSGSGKLDLVTPDISLALKDREIIFYAIPAYAHGAAVRATLPHLRSGQTLIFISYFACLRMRNLISQERPGLDVVLAEMLSCMFAGRKISLDTAVIEKRKRGLPVAALPASGTDQVVRLLSEILEDLVPARNWLETSVRNTNPVLHVPCTLLNLGWIEATGGQFDFYREAKTSSILRVEKAVDEEIQALCRALSIPDSSLLEMSASFYSTASAQSVPVSTQEGERVPNAPDSTDHRYLTEDVPYGLVPLLALGEGLQVQLPVISGLVELATVATGRNYLREGTRLIGFPEELTPGSQELQDWLGVSMGERNSNDVK